MSEDNAPFGPERISPASTHGHELDEQANDFACAIMMPEESFRQHYAQLEGNPFKLAKAFQLPVSAVYRRIAMLNLANSPVSSDRWN